MSRADHPGINTPKAKEVPVSAKDRLDEISRGDRTGGEHIQLVAALRAVLELHYDIEIPRLICSVCRVSWPCPTVKAIEEALR